MLRDGSFEMGGSDSGRGVAGAGDRGWWAPEITLDLKYSASQGSNQPSSILKLIYHTEYL